MESITLNLADVVAAVSFLLGGGGVGAVVAKKRGWVTFGKPTERRACPANVRKICGEHNAMIIDMNHITSDVLELKRSQQSNTKILHKIASQVDRIVGYHQGQNGVDLGG